MANNSRKNAAETRPDGMPIGRPFQKGNSGRPKGSRNALGEAFIKALQDDFNEHGELAIQTVRTEKPDQYLKVIASILPKDINLNVNEFEDASDEELIERLRELESVISPFLTSGGGKTDARTKAQAKSTKH